MKRTISLLITVILVTACGEAQQQTKSTTVKGQISNASNSSKEEFAYVPPAVPLTITDQSAAIAWATDNYWATLPIGDSSIVGTAGLQEAYAMWVLTMRLAPLELSRKAINNTYHSLQGNKPLHAEFLRLGEGYLGDPNSELRNDSLYLVLLDYMIATDALSDVEKIRPTELRKLILKNQVGTTAANLNWSDIAGKTQTLYGLKSEYKLLFFYSPGCESCAALFSQIDRSSELATLVKENKLTLIALYDEGDVQKWRAYAKNISSGWINGLLGEDFIEQKPYAIRATPSLYLLGKSNVVLMRDGASLQEILRPLASAGVVPVSHTIIE